MAIVRFFAAAKAITKTSEIQAAGRNVAEVLEVAKKEFPGLATVLTKCSILVNEISCTDLNTAIGQDDLIDVLPPFAGG